MAESYADGNFRYPIVQALRKLGHDVLTCQEAGRAGQGVSDEQVIADALAVGRIVLTQDRRDFIKLHLKGIAHAGIVVCTFDPDADGHARRIGAMVARQPQGGRWLVRVNRPNTSDRSVKNGLQGG